jgi:hypothetical protein
MEGRWLLHAEHLIGLGRTAKVLVEDMQAGKPPFHELDIDIFKPASPRPGVDAFPTA